MLIVNDEQRLRAGIKSLSKRCSYCSQALAACAVELATEILVDLYTFFRPPAPYRQLFVLTASPTVPCS
jgi:hypothetical protein